jgi:hypothetical protein
MSTRSPLTAASSALLRYTYDTFFDICTPSDGRPIYDSCVASLHRPSLLSSTATLYRLEGHGESSLAYSPVASSYQCTQPSPEPHEVTPQRQMPRSHLRTSSAFALSCHFRRRRALFGLYGSATGHDRRLCLVWLGPKPLAALEAVVSIYAAPRAVLSR